MAWVLPLHENEGQDKRVESISVPCLDEGSNPSISTKLAISRIFAFFCENALFVGKNWQKVHCYLQESIKCTNFAPNFNERALL